MDQQETAQAGEWLELSVEADLEAVEAVSEVLSRYGYGEGIVIEEGHRSAEDGVCLERDPGRPAVVRTYLPRTPQAEEKAQRIEAVLSLLGNLRPIGPLRVAVLAEQDWAEAWKAHYSVLHVGERIVVVPAWQPYQAGGEEIVLTLDPGMAFGTGLHPTTQLCLRALEQQLRPGVRVLDLGTGSGILAIAAARLGSGPVLALDTDPTAVRAARQNVLRNHLGGTISVEEGTLRPGLGPFDLILANLLARTLRELAGLLADALAPGGLLIGSGVLAEQRAEVERALEAAGLQLLASPRQEEWVVLLAHP